MTKKLESAILKDLPVNTISDDVLNNVSKGVQIVSSPTGSGKTLTIPTKWADRLPEEERVVVLVPRRFLAINAAETVAELSHTTVGNEVGYAVGMQGGDEPLYGKNSKVVFMTYGYAVSSGTLMYEKNIVLDEVHEASMDISIVKAILHNRKREDQNLNIIEMSATIDLDKQINYWKEYNPTAHQCEGKTFGCEIIEEDEKSEAEMAVELLQNHNRKGIAIFESGKADIQEVISELEMLLEKNNIKNVEIASIYGEMDSQERRKALAAPSKNKKKIIVGTNVIESGMNIAWLDAGISSGKGKGLYATGSEAVVLKEDNLPQWRLQQQKGRVCRFTDGIFVLASDTKWQDRPVQTVAEISRLPLSELVLSCAKFGLQTENMHFDARIDSEQLKLAKKKLLRLKLIDDNSRITDLGKYVTGLPVSPETGLMLKYAQSRAYCLPHAVILAGILEQGNMRQSFNYSHEQNQNSDVFDALLAFVRVEKELVELRKKNKSKQQEKNNKTFAQKLKEKEKSQSELQDEELSYNKREEIFKKYNMSKKRFYEARETIKDLSKRFKIHPDFTNDDFDFTKLKQCMLAGNIAKLHLNKTNIFENSYYNISKSSALYYNSPSHYLGTPKIITPRNGRSSFTIVENVTALSSSDINTFLSKNIDLINSFDGYAEFRILDSKPIIFSQATDALKEYYNEKINQALQILEQKGPEEFKAFATANSIPERCWKDKFSNDETQADNRARKVLGLPLLNCDERALQILGISSYRNNNEQNEPVIINEQFLKQNNLIKDNQLSVNLDLLYPIVFEINNSELNAHINLTGTSQHNMDFSNNTFKSLRITSDNKDINPSFSMKEFEAETIEYSNLNLYQVFAEHLKCKNLNFHKTDAFSLQLHNSSVTHLSLEEDQVHYLHIYSTNFGEQPQFDKTEILQIYTDEEVTLNGSSLHFINGENGYFPSKLSEKELAAQEKQRREEAERIARERAAHLEAIEQEIIANFHHNLYQTTGEQLIEGMQNYLQQNRENLPISPSLEEMGKIKENLFNIRKEQVQKHQSEQMLKREHLEKVEFLQPYYYDVIAQEITGEDNTIIRSATGRKSSLSKIFENLDKQIEFEDWDKINITPFKLEEGISILNHNVKYMEENYVVPDIKRNHGVYNPDNCYFSENRVERSTPHIIIAQREEKNRLKEAKNKAKQTSAENIDITALAGLWGANIIRSKSGRK